MNPHHLLHSSASTTGPAPATRAVSVHPSARRRAGTATSRQPAGAGEHGEGNADEEDGIHRWPIRQTGVVTVIAILAIGLVALVVLAAVVGIVDASQAGTWREIARERRADWEQRRREERLTSARDHFPGL